MPLRRAMVETPQTRTAHLEYQKQTKYRTVEIRSAAERPTASEDWDTGGFPAAGLGAGWEENVSWLNLIFRPGAPALWKFIRGARAAMLCLTDGSRADPRNARWKMYHLWKSPALATLTGLQRLQALTAASHRCLGATLRLSPSRSRGGCLHRLDHTRRKAG